MNRSEFIEELKNRIKALPDSEIDDVILYYEEYFDEAGEENEQEVITELGSPSEIAAKIISEFAIKDIDANRQTAKKALNTIWIVLLAMFPITLPLALATLVITFALIIVVFSVLFIFGVTAISLCASGLVLSVMCITLLFSDVATAIFFIGFGITAISLGLLFFKATISLSKISFSGIAKITAKILGRGGAK